MARYAALTLCVVLCACTTTPDRTVNVPVPVLPDVPESWLNGYNGEWPTASEDGTTCFSADDTKRLQELLHYYITTQRAFAELWAHDAE